MRSAPPCAALCVAAIAAAHFVSSPARAAAPAAPGATTAVEISTLVGQMKYDVEQFAVAPGARVRLTLRNEDDLHHNLVICRKGADAQAVAHKALELGGDGFAKQWIPDHPAVLVASPMVDPKAAATLEFTAPEEPGTYPYVCTLPGHSMLMKGAMLVGDAGPDSGLRELTYTLFRGNWNKLPAFDELEPANTDHVPGGLIDLARVPKASGNHFAVVFNGKLDVATAGDYSFRVTSDDGSRVLVGGRTVVDHDGIHGTSSKEGKVRLESGTHDLEVQYFEAAGEETLALSWSGPGFKDESLSGTQARENSRRGPSGIVLAPPPGEAIIYRNFIEGAGARAIGVGYPGQKNLAFDADEIRLALVWQGAFIDAARHWTGRGQGYQPPHGYNVYQSVAGVPFARLADGDAAWPDTARKRGSQQPDNGYVFKGYRLVGDGRLPEFHYTFEGLEVSDFFTPITTTDGTPARLVRTITLTGDPTDHLYFRAAAGSISTTDDGTYVIDGGKARLQVACDGSEPLVRESGGRQELLVPVAFDGRDAVITQQFLFSH